jgi:hypothetical protein
MESLQAHEPVEPPSEKNFAWTFFAVFALLAVYLGRHGNPAYFALMAPGIVLLAMGYLKPAWLVQPNTLWFRFGRIVHRMVSPVFLALLYLLAFVPTGLILRLMKKDVLRLKFDPGAPTYWTPRPKVDNSMTNQF